MFAPAFSAEPWTNTTSFGPSASLLSAETGGPSAGFMLCAERGAGDGQWARAAASLHDAVAMAQAVRINDARAETQLVLAKFHLDQLADARGVAEVLATRRYISRLDLAALWLAIGDGEQAKNLALEAYRYAWSDGDPFVARWPLNKSRSLLNQIGAEVPNLPSYDPTKDEKEFWEESVSAAVEELQAHKAAETATRKESADT